MNNFYVSSLSNLDTSLSNAGGKGLSLSRMIRSGLPVPDGFYVSTAAYRSFILLNDLQGTIDRAYASVDINQPRSVENVSKLIRDRILDAPIPQGIIGAVKEVYNQLVCSSGDGTVAVRSSATAEDLPEASFAGQQDTFLNIHGIDQVLIAIRKCWASLWTARAMTYRAQYGFDTADLALAVVVQCMVPAQVAGVLFTINPVSGSTDQVLISGSWGLGEAVVSGAVTPDTLVVDKRTGKVIHSEIGQKLVQTVVVENGTTELAVPENLQNSAVLKDDQVMKLINLARRVEALFGVPQDIEWALTEDEVYLLQARPITTINQDPPSSVSHNATLDGDYMWTNMIVGEVFPTAVTPATWSIWEDLFNSLSFGDVPGIGNIAGRPYLNYSLTYSFLLKMVRNHDRVMETIKDMIGTPPEGMAVPSFPVPWRTILFKVIPQEFKKELKKKQLKKNFSQYISEVRSQCFELKEQIKVSDESELVSLWNDHIWPLWQETHLLQDGLNEDLQGLTKKLKSALTKYQSVIDVNTLLTSIQSGDLASLGPVVGLDKVQRGELTHQEYLELFGHRGPNENELAELRPYENENWLDEQLAAFSSSPVNVSAQLKKRKFEFNTYMNEVTAQLPLKKARQVIHLIEQTAKVNADREAIRSELTRVIDLIRVFFINGGDLTGYQDDVFFLTIDELIASLSGQIQGDQPIALRKKRFEQERSLPKLPTWILGHFDPFEWASKPNHRSDAYSSQAILTQQPDIAARNEGIIHGQPGSSGHVEGLVRRLDDPADGDKLQAGEILVTSTTNIGWTPLFPRAGAVVTDIGGSLSHAAIVARELGIPAVVGCRDATIRLQTGDRVRVDGASGMIEILETVKGTPNE